MGGLNAKKREQNVKSGFRLRIDEISNLASKEVLLINDVIKTGATLESHAQLLLKTGRAYFCKCSWSFKSNLRLDLEINKETLYLKLMICNCKAHKMSSATKVEIYTSMFCGYCVRAKRLLSAKGIDFSEQDVTTDKDGRQIMTQRASGCTSVPQIFINGNHIGGCDELLKLEATGTLDQMLSLRS